MGKNTGREDLQGMAKIARFEKYDFEEGWEMIEDVINFRKEHL